MPFRDLRIKAVFLVILGLLSINGFAQEDEEFWTKLLNEEVEVENPVYKPVISLGAGVLNFMGDIRNPGANLLSGKFGYKLNVSTLFGKKNYYKLNFYVTMGSLNGHDFDISRRMQLSNDLPVDEFDTPIFPNSSFSTDFIQFGINAEYGFGHLISGKKFKPFISFGIAPIQFTPKFDLTYGGPTDYYYFWSDGTVRNFQEGGIDAWRARIIPMDGEYETDPKKVELDITQTSVTFPVEVGFDFYLSDRVNLRIATSVSYALTDLLDSYDSNTADRYKTKSNGRSDMFSFTYFTMNFDLFSDAKTMLIEKAFAELDDFAYELLADQDNDGYFDVWDKCPDTPAGVVVDSTGCPLDGDNDGIFDYEDQEQGTPQGATVDNQGVQLSPEKISEMFEPKNAVNRKEIKLVPVAPIWTRSITFTPGVIPDKFKKVDIDGDGYISFVELLKAVDDYFDEKTDFKTDDIYELNNFFFSQ